MRFLLCLTLFGLPTPGSAQINPDNRLAHTYSIVARDPDTGEMGVAVQSHWFSVGSVVSWAEAGVGAIATQSFVNVSFGPRGLELLKSGKSAQETLDALLASDDGRDVRQVGIVDSKGNVAAWTGKSCIPAAGHFVGKNYSVEANLMLNDKVWPAMSRAFESSKGPLAERMLAALEAAQEVGGDIRGRQSCAILVVIGTSTGRLWEDRLIDLRIEDHPTPISEMKRLLRLFRAYEHMNKGDLAVEKNDIEGANFHYGSAEQMFPDNLEMKYWHAVALANAGKVGESLPLFKEIFKQDANWHTLTGRLPAVNLLIVTKADLEKILAQK
ncbi:MAG: DUF1028 domain-containing protein [Bacteroidetes bacterium]|nr:DUF1028 domain-containing protein [Bacteroidota bacterium]